jgi:hypothetical protein
VRLHMSKSTLKQSSLSTSEIPAVSGEWSSC